MALKIVQELELTNYDGVKQLLYLIVAGLTVREDFADVVDWSLYPVGMPEFLPLNYQGSTDDLGGGHNIQEEGLVGLQ
jgi:hypothetical protein